ncbi:MAG: LppY/LpqO family protein [Myxococcales bacterium]|nr:LppY/LpqO family protein [Myxococcales bacterium]
MSRAAPRLVTHAEMVALAEETGPAADVLLLELTDWWDRRPDMKKWTLLMAILTWSGVAAAAPALDTAQLEQLTGAKGKLDDKEGVFKVSVPRADLKVVAAGVHLTPPMGLTTWAAFTRNGAHTMVMGDLCLTEDQVNPVMTVALANSLEVTALHNHFFWDSPKVMFMHIGGMGDAATLAAAVGKVFAKIKETAGGKGVVPKADIDPAKTSLDPAKIEAVLGSKGELAGGVYKVTIGRTTKMGGHAVGKTMGVNTWAAFAGSDEQAIVDGDFAMLETELQGVLKALRGANIDVVAIHQHMTGEQPRVMFLHYWGLGRTTELARGLAAALDKTGK